MKHEIGGITYGSGAKDTLHKHTPFALGILWWTNDKDKHCHIDNNYLHWGFEYACIKCE